MSSSQCAIWVGLIWAPTQQEWVSSYGKLYMELCCVCLGICVLSAMPPASSSEMSFSNMFDDETISSEKASTWRWRLFILNATYILDWSGWKAWHAHSLHHPNKGHLLTPNLLTLHEHGFSLWPWSCETNVCLWNWPITLLTASHPSSNCLPSLI